MKYPEILDGIIAYINFLVDNSRDKEVTRYGINSAVGKKYMRITLNKKTIAYIVKCDDDPKFKEGDILKLSRKNSIGNVIEGNFYNFKL